MNFVLPALATCASMILIRNYEHPIMKKLTATIGYISSAFILATCSLVGMPNIGLSLGLVYACTPDILTPIALAGGTFVLAIRMGYEYKIKKANPNQMTSYFSIMMVNQLCMLLSSILSGQHYYEIKELKGLLTDA